MSRLNVENRTLAIMDNLTFLRSINNECIDLIAIDPPFAANETFTNRPRPPISREELDEEIALARAHGVPHNEGIGETRIKDVWNWDEDVHPAWKARIEDDYPRVFKVIQTIEDVATENEAAYICFMAVRLIECHRVLKPTGSIYVHCDTHANSYLRMLLDAIFGAQNLLNEIVWYYRGAGIPKTSRARRHDTILWFAKRNGEHYFDPDPIRLQYAKATRERFKHHIGNVRDGRDYGQQTLNPKGKHPDDVIAHIQPIAPSAKERVGYATQKPLSLLENLISSSSNPGDVVLDIFAGCATTAVAAERLGRRWIACDMAYRSWTMLKRRFYQNGYALSDMTDSTRNVFGDHQPKLQEAESRTIGPKELPKRDDRDPAPHHPLAQSRRGRRSTQTASWSGRISKEEAKKLLIDKFGPVCWGCGYEPRRPNGSLDDTLLEVDHIRARRASEGTQGDDELYNLALLHRTCNGIKRNRLTLEELRNHNALNGLLYVNNPRELVDLFEATRFANDQIARHVAEHGYQPIST